MCTLISYVVINKSLVHDVLTIKKQQKNRSNRLINNWSDTFLNLHVGNSTVSIKHFKERFQKRQNVSRTFQVSLLAVSTVSRSQVSLYLNQLHAAWAEHNPQLCACAAHLSSVRLDMLLIFIIDCIDHLSEFLMRSLFSLSLPLPLSRRSAVCRKAAVARLELVSIQANRWRQSRNRMTENKRFVCSSRGGSDRN